LGYAPGDPVETYVAGVTFKDRQVIIRSLTLDDMLWVGFDEENIYDRNAIYVNFESKRIGFIPADLATKIHKPMERWLQVPITEVPAGIIRFTNVGTNHQGLIIRFLIPWQEEYENETRSYFPDY